ncbi:hypothetical protein [Mesonia aestuariivivens]|uniref:TerB family tellurite resistance protein n=1 Tax=Mesonia aestuariivivens TaxID=2796128 RepID=A0ABS6W1C9_9FLAO|nr:hypothetical protein [Mesonia aestuariivivens]MBW2961662.1 hypothetical protein [Mesonia aestuariivivens]
MLSKGIKDEEKEQVDKALNQLLTWSYIPEEWQKQDREKFSLHLKQQLDYTLNELLAAENDDFKKHLNKKKFDFDLYEKLADLFQQIIDLETPAHQALLAEKIIFIYETAQEESKTFSFDLVQKISATQKYLSNS